MVLMSDAAEWWWLLIAHGCQAMPILKRQLADSFMLELGFFLQFWLGSVKYFKISTSRN
jgi:hypothetical protein